MTAVLPDVVLLRSSRDVLHGSGATKIFSGFEAEKYVFTLQATPCCVVAVQTMKAAYALFMSCSIL